jgi:hypothetical protein
MRPGKLLSGYRRTQSDNYKNKIKQNNTKTREKLQVRNIWVEIGIQDYRTRRKDDVDGVGEDSWLKEALK